jgi:hypothetical protein
MFKCQFCGFDNLSEKARFCVECGPDSPSKEWTAEDIDQPLTVTQYVSMLEELYFDAQSESAVEKLSLRMRERLKISHGTHTSVLAQFAAQKKAIKHIANFRFEFNEAVLDAYAGHDTFLNFRYTNLSEGDLFKVSLAWDDPGPTARIGLRTQTSSFVKPQMAVTLGATIIFERMGIKELAGMLITITDQFGESANFKAEPFRFRVGSHEQKVTQITSTHNQISIEGRGVVDASGMGADNSEAQSDFSIQPKWRALGITYVPRSPPLSLHAPDELNQRASQQYTKPIKVTAPPTIEFDGLNILSVQDKQEKQTGESAALENNCWALKETADMRRQEVLLERQAADNQFLNEAERLDTVDSYRLDLTNSKYPAFHEESMQWISQIEHRQDGLILSRHENAENQVLAATKSAKEEGALGTLGQSSTLKEILIDGFCRFANIEHRLENFYVPPIKPTKLKSAVAAYAHGVLPEEVILLYDPTVFGKADIGFLITSTALYRSEASRNLLENGSNLRYLLKHIKHFNYCDIDKCFIVNGDHIDCSLGIKKEVGEAFAERFNSLLSQVVAQLSAPFDIEQ